MSKKYTEVCLGDAEGWSFQGIQKDTEIILEMCRLLGKLNLKFQTLLFALTGF